MGRLDDLGQEMQSKHLTLSTLESLRSGVLSGERLDLPSAQRQYLERGSPLIGEVTFDARHRPISTNTTRHFQHLRTLAEDVVVRFHAFMPLKRVSTGSYTASGPAALLLVIDDASRLSAYDPESGGAPLMGPMDLGHGAGRAVTHLATTSSQESHLVVTADDAGELRVHALRVVARRENRTKDEEEKLAHSGRQMSKLNVTANFSCSFALPSAQALGGGEQPKLVTVLPIDRGEKVYFLTGDTLGGISVFFRNGTLKGRVRVTEDPGGVRGLLKGQSQLVLFFSSHSFGSFSVTQVDVQATPCSGWNAPVHDVVLDPGYQSSRVVLSLSDGDVLVYSTTRGKSKACDLTLKFPHVTTQPFKLQVFRGHIMALTAPLADDPRSAEHLREIYFFNLAAMEEGYGPSPSRTVTLQASFKPRQPEDLALSVAMGAGGQPDRSKAHIGVRFVDVKGVELYGLTLKSPANTQASAAISSGGLIGGEPDEPTWWSAVLGWVPKLGIFGLSLTGIVVWSLGRASGGGLGAGDEIDEEFFQEQLRKARDTERAARGGSRGGAGVTEDDD